MVGNCHLWLDRLEYNHTKVHHTSNVNSYYKKVSIIFYSLAYKVIFCQILFACQVSSTIFWKPERIQPFWHERQFVMGWRLHECVQTIIVHVIDMFSLN